MPFADESDVIGVPSGSISRTIESVREMAERLAELEAALRNLVAWEGPIELCAPELGGALKALYEARAVLEKR